ncbi:MAG: hypothetical protein U0S50_12150 [Sphingopyxis sp.]|uniref:hypothetical protein n=1 Tax=Sphingopyxis sp. TaxID=1908224 RepID=UPI002AB84CE7|nr:hypothetical protein [Sphingopyxis sp.]MDZ3832547.1 hypothetical protein [Sphingopyxis sp.]
MKRLLFLLSGTLSVSMAAPALAMEKNEEKERACVPAESVETTIPEVIGLGDAAIGKCVTVDGWAIGIFVHAGNEARYRQQSIYNDFSSTGAILGLYGRDLNLDPAIIRATGRIDSCEAIYDRVVAAGGVPFLGGFCHYYKGYVLKAETVAEIGKLDLVRIPARLARPDLGNLSAIQRGGARDRLAAAFAPLLVALRHRDEVALRDFLGQVDGVALPEDQLTKRVAALTEGDTLSAALPKTGDVAVEYFGWREPAWADADSRAGNAEDIEQTVTGLACAGPSLTAERKLWPISSGDGGYAAGRPYVCARIFIGADGVAHYEIFPENRTIREPD